MRDLGTIDPELPLLAAVRWSIREHGGKPSSRHVNELLRACSNWFANSRKVLRLNIAETAMASTATVRVATFPQSMDRVFHPSQMSSSTQSNMAGSLPGCPRGSV